MVAREVHLRATGSAFDKRVTERGLFNEETTSVLVCETGGVILLSTGVATGQLLVLTNVESKREVVAQVKRKRVYRPTSCFLELEFAEPAPHFWGTEFSAATALLPKDARDAEAAALVLSAEATAEAAGEPPAGAPAEEVEAFKREVAALRDQPKLMDAFLAAPEATEAVALVVSNASPTLMAGEVQSTESNSNGRLGEPPRVTFVAKDLPSEHHTPSPPWIADEQGALPKSSRDFSRSLPKSKRLRRARGSFTPGFRGGALRLAVLTAMLVMTIVGAAWFKHWIPWKPAVKKPAVSSSASAARAKTSSAAGSAQANSEFGNVRVASDAPVTSPSQSAQSVALPNAALQTPADAAELAVRPLGTKSSVSLSAAKRTAPSTAVAGNRSADWTAGKPASASVAPSATGSPFQSPVLVKSARAVASLEALRDFERGNVVIDAVVGTSGEVNFVSVLSGPPSLRASAVESLKQYEYEPATRNGQPVPAHVTITIHFRFEP